MSDMVGSLVHAEYMAQPYSVHRRSMAFVNVERRALLPSLVRLLQLAVFSSI